MRRRCLLSFRAHTLSFFKLTDFLRERVLMRATDRDNTACSKLEMAQNVEVNVVGVGHVARVSTTARGVTTPVSNVLVCRVYNLSSPKRQRTEYAG